MTKNEFYENICAFKGNFENRELETYLLSLLKLVEQEKNQNLTADLLLNLLQQAFTAEPEEFNPEWLNILKAPDENIISKKFTNPETNASIDKSIVSDKSGIDYSIAVLQFQISELHKMNGKQLNEEMRYFGIDSETGNRWYNFDPMTNLECGVRCILDSEEDEVKEFIVSWQTLGELLEMGRIYE
ncbi:hypothetical protein [Sphingobacterium siyangense]|jgi:hypothetical protein|uniref:hypothetical protein n=1 Tax=Sphingobacterium siyangense TaxID=459529 RepID=UPI0028AF16FE|nr:hypothetical protein [Sphingobacterium siyangense]